MKQDDYFCANFDRFQSDQYFFEASGASATIGLKENNHIQVKFIQPRDA